MHLWDLDAVGAKYESIYILDLVPCLSKFTHEKISHYFEGRFHLKYLSNWLLEVSYELDTLHRTHLSS